MRGPRTRKSTVIELSELVSPLGARSPATSVPRKALPTRSRHLIAAGTSAGGAWAKAVVARNPVTGELRSGQVPADPGFERGCSSLTVSVRTPTSERPGNFGRIEYAYHRMALAAGIEMTECRLLEEGGRAHFIRDALTGPTMAERSTPRPCAR